MDITSLSDFMTPVRRVRHCANRTTIRYIPMQSSNSLATRLLANELNFSLSPCFVLSLLPHRASPFFARFHCRHRSGKTSTSVYNSKEYYIVLERYLEPFHCSIYTGCVYIRGTFLNLENARCLFIELWDKFGELNEIGARTKYVRKKEREEILLRHISFRLTRWISFNIINSM